MSTVREITERLALIDQVVAELCALGHPARARRPEGNPSGWDRPMWLGNRLASIDEALDMLAFLRGEHPDALRAFLALGGL